MERSCMSESDISISRDGVDVCLMLRADTEMRCLSREVIPVLRQLETGERLPRTLLDAALAYLEVMWLEAQRRAAETDVAYDELKRALGAEPSEQDAVHGQACRYRGAVVTLRRTVSRRIAPLLMAGAEEPATMSDHER
jgi:hypothetical protein